MWIRLNAAGTQYSASQIRWANFQEISAVNDDDCSWWFGEMVIGEPKQESGMADLML